MKVFRVLTVLSVLFLLVLTNTHFINAQTVDELKAELEQQQNLIKRLDKEIAEKQLELQQIGGEKNTLQTAIRSLELSRNKLQTDISKTEAQIGKAESTLKKLGLEIDTLGKKEQEAKQAIESSIRTISELENESPVEAFLSTGTLTEFWRAAEEASKLNASLYNHVQKIHEIRGDLRVKHTETEKEKESLLSLKKNLSGQKVSIDSTKKEKDTLLSQTKNKEAEYQKVIEDKLFQKKAFEIALFDTEAKLKIALDPKTFPTAQPSILSWPLTNVRITQLFGSTADSKRLYKSGTHNGVDFGVPDGTPILAALGGRVTAIGNTDGGGCYSYGKWILVGHDNGLSTMYAHLSSHAVKQGDLVTTGGTIGYSGRTGYATGPHLHFTVYATQGMRVQQYTSSINCKHATIPIADPTAYLDPMDYLPSL